MLSSDIMEYGILRIRYNFVLLFFLALFLYLCITGVTRCARDSIDIIAPLNDVGLMYFNNYSTRYLSSEMEIGRRRPESEGKSQGASSSRKIPRRDDD